MNMSGLDWMMNTEELSSRDNRPTQPLIQFYKPSAKETTMKKFVIGLFLLAITCTLGGCIQSATGERVGTVTKLSKQGIFCPTYEAEIIKGGMAGGSGAFGHPFDFTVEDKTLLDTINTAMAGGKEIKITFHTEEFTFCRSESGGDFVDKVDVLN
jgi:hypothetical protein